MPTRLLFLCLFTFLMIGCSNDGSLSANLPAEPVARQSTLNGTFSLDTRGILAQRALTGTVAAEGPVAADVELVEVGSSYRIRATLADGTVLLADVSLAQADALAASGAGERGEQVPYPWIWVTPVSTLVSVYREAHPDGAAGVEAVSKVKAFLGISPQDSVNRPFVASARSEFSPRAFLQAASAAGGPVAFSQSLVGAIDAGQTRPFLETGARVQGKISLLGIAGGLLGNVVGGLATDFIWKALGYGAGKLGIQSATQQQLDEISSQLTSVQNQITDLQGELGTLQLASSLSSSTLINLDTYTQKENSALAAAIADYKPGQPNDLSFAAGWFGLLDTGKSVTYATSIVEALTNSGASAGLGNILTGYTQVYAQPFGSGLNGYKQYSDEINWPNYYDFRNDVLVTEPILNCADYYGSYLGEAANMLAESENQTLTGMVPGSGASTVPGSPVNFLNQARSYLNGYLTQVLFEGGSVPTNPTTTFPQSVGGLQNGVGALSKRILQQVPGALLGGQSVLPGVWAAPADPESNGGFAGSSHLDGTLWTPLGVEITTSGDSSPYTLDMVAYFGVANWYQWMIPTEDEVKQLFARAQQIGALDGLPDKQQIPYGLHKMGLISDANYQPGMETVQVYNNYSNNGTQNLRLFSYRSDNGNNYDNGFNVVTDKNGDRTYEFKPQDGHLSIVLLVRSFPGQPQGFGPSSLYDGVNEGAATIDSAPVVVQSSRTVQQIQELNGAGSVFEWNSTIALAGGFVPDEIVIDREGPQLHAYALWMVGQRTAPPQYNELFFQQYHPVLTQSPGYYLIWTEVTDRVEWLSSDTYTAEVANNAPTALTVLGGTSSGLEGVAVIEGAADGSLSGATLIGAQLSAGSSSGATTAQGLPFSGSLTPSVPVGQDPSVTVNLPATLSNATLTGGTIMGGRTFRLDRTDGQRTSSLTVGARLSGATATGGVATVPTLGQAGLLTVHDSQRSASLTASWMYSPSTSTATNNPTISKAAFLPAAPNGVAAPYFGSTPYLLPAGALSAPAGLNSLVISPDNLALKLQVGGTDQSFFLTGLRNDGTYLDLTNDPGTTWEVYIPTSSGSAPPTLGPGTDAAFSSTAPFRGTLQFPQTFNYTGNLVIRASNGGRVTFAQISVLAPP